MHSQYPSTCLARCAHHDAHEKYNPDIPFASPARGHAHATHWPPISSDIASAEWRLFFYGWCQTSSCFNNNSAAKIRKTSENKIRKLFFSTILTEKRGRLGVLASFSYKFHSNDVALLRLVCGEINWIFVALCLVLSQCPHPHSCHKHYFWLSSRALCTQNKYTHLIHNDLHISKNRIFMKGKTHAWFIGYWTMVHGHLKHCALAVEQLFICRWTIVRWNTKNASVIWCAKWHGIPYFLHSCPLGCPPLSSATNFGSINSSNQLSNGFLCLFQPCSNLENIRIEFKTLISWHEKERMKSTIVTRKKFLKKKTVTFVKK